MESILKIGIFLNKANQRSFLKKKIKMHRYVNFKGILVLSVKSDLTCSRGQEKLALSL